MKKSFYLFFSLMLFFVTINVKAAPVSYLTEQVNASFFANGSLTENITRIGYAEVGAGNQIDVLQYIRINLSKTDGTNLNSVVAYKDVAASPEQDSRTRLYLNTTNGENSLTYEINPDIVPVIYLKINYSNIDGGRDIHPGSNLFFFNITLNSTKTISPASFVFQSSKNTHGSNDSMNIFNATATTGSVLRTDTDVDGFYDKITWNGNLSEGEDIYLAFYANITPDINFDESLMYVDTDSSDSYAHHSEAQTFTGIEFIDRFSRGPIRQGIEMIKGDTWAVRGFIKNIATGLDYIIHGWSLYEIGNQTPVITSSQESYIQPGEKKYTDWYDTGEINKQLYYSSAFDWEVIWGQSVYSASTHSKIRLPKLYEIDSWVDKTANLNANTESGRTVIITDKVRHLGHSSLYVDKIYIHSVVPRTSTDNSSVSWNINNVKVYYVNTTNRIDITSGADVSVKNPDASSDGYVNVDIENLSAIIGHVLGQNDDIELVYNIEGSSFTSTKTYLFSQQSTLWTTSGTPVTKETSYSLTIPGVSVTQPPSVSPGGGGGAAPSQDFADIIKESLNSSFKEPNLVNVNVTYKVIDSGTKGIKNMRLLIYVPEDSEFYESALEMYLYDAETEQWIQLKRNQDFVLINNGPKWLESKKYIEYLIKKKSPEGALYEDTFNLFNEDRMRVNYKVKIPPGTHFILTRATGYDYYKDRIIFEDVYVFARREGGWLEPVSLKETEWIQQKAEVNKAVEWIKRYDIYNPNNVTVEENIRTYVFPDTITANIIDTKKTKLELLGEKKIYVEWTAKLKPKETKSFYIQVTTPPVIETNRELNILESNKTRIIFLINITLKNFANEKYKNVSYLFPVLKKNIIEINANAEVMEYNNQTKFLIKDIGPGVGFNFSIVYKETPPLLITTPNALKYGCNEKANITIFIIPSEKQGGSYIEIEIVGPKPRLTTVYADIIPVPVKEYGEIKIPLTVNLNSLPSGKYFIYTKFKKDFGTILSDVQEFWIDCPLEVIHISYGFVILAAAGIVAYLLVRVKKRKKTYEDEIKKLKKEIKKLG